jgi:predicted nucleic acid-binding protein
MKVIVDTCVWSPALRKPVEKNPILTQQLENLINDFRVQMIGPIRQELLSGIPTSDQFDKLKKNLGAFADLPISTDDYERAAVFFNLCRKKRIQGSHTDFLICALSVNHKMLIFTTDKDFYHYKKIIPIELFE